MKGLLLLFDIWTHVFDSIIILLCHCKYVNKYTQTHSERQNLETSTSAWNLSKRVEISRLLVFRLYFWNFDIITTYQIWLIWYPIRPLQGSGIQQFFKTTLSWISNIHPRWNSRFGYTLYWVQQTRPGCDVVTDWHNRNVQMYLLLTIICTMWRLENTICIQYLSPRTTMQLSDTGAGGDNLTR